jgi:hypothetical protein
VVYFRRKSMTRFVLATTMVVVFGSAAFAQPLPNPVPVITPQTLVPVPHPNPVPPFPTYAGPPGPAIPFVKSGGRVVGLDGYYPYDTGLYLLAGDAVSRQAGYFTMVFPNGNAPGTDAPPAAPAASAPHAKHRLFHR